MVLFQRPLALLAKEHQRLDPTREQYGYEVHRHDSEEHFCQLCLENLRSLALVIESQLEEERKQQKNVAWETQIEYRSEHLRIFFHKPEARVDCLRVNK
jgi:hypothetical protein